MSKNYHDCYTALFERAYMLFGNEKQQAIAKKTGLPQGIISKIRSCYEYPNETYQPQAETVYKIAKAYNVSTDYLLGLTDVKTTDKATVEMCKALGLTEDAVRLLLGDDSVYKQDELKLAHSNIPRISKIWAEDSANVCASVFNRLADEMLRDRKKSLIEFLSNFFATAGALEYNFFNLRGEASDAIVVQADLANDAFVSMGVTPKELLMTLNINNIVAHLNRIKEENK